MPILIDLGVTFYPSPLKNTVQHLCNRFWTTLVPIVLPFIYYLSEAIFYFLEQKREDEEDQEESNTIQKELLTTREKVAAFFKILLSFLLWPAFIVFQIAYYSKKFKIDRKPTKDMIRKFDLMYIDAQIIEVCKG